MRSVSESLNANGNGSAKSCNVLMREIAPKHPTEDGFNTKDQKMAALNVLFSECV